MAQRLYALVEAAGGNTDKALRALRGRPGVIVVDPLEDGMDMMLVIEANDQQSLKRIVIQTMFAAGGLIDNIRIMPTMQGLKTLRPKAFRGHAHQQTVLHAMVPVGFAS